MPGRNSENIFDPMPASVQGNSAMAATRSLEDEIEAIPENLFREPVDYLYADHFRQRVLCKRLDEIAGDPDGPEVPRLAAMLMDYLEHDLPQHMADEEHELFPRLRVRCRPADNLDRTSALLAEEHRRDADLSAEIIAGLRRLKAGKRLVDERDFTRLAATFAESQRRHLAWEEALILSLARRRLKAEDLREIGRAMAQRRGAAYPE